MGQKVAIVTGASRGVGKGIALGWVALRDGSLPDTVTIDGMEARRAPVPFYDPEGVRSRA